MREKKSKFCGRIILGLVVAALSVALFSVTGCSKKKEVVQEKLTRPAKIMTINQAGSSVTRKYPGKVRALDRVELSFEVSGKLVDLPIKAGQDIKKGAVIAQIDPSDFQSKLDAALARENQARSELERFANLLKDRVVARSNYDVKKRNYDVATADVKIAMKALGNTKLRAPFDGRIGRKLVENFQVVQAKQAIIVLQKVGIVEIIVNAPERAMAEARKNDGGEISAEFASLPGRHFPLKLKEFATEADPQTQTYKVVLSMDTPKGINILDGMTATVSRTSKRSGATSLEIPAPAVFAGDNEKSFVWLVGDDMTVTAQAVEVGLMRAGNITVTAGLSQGDRIITAGVQNLVSGEKVREFTGTIGE